MPAGLSARRTHRPGARRPRGVRAPDAVRRHAPGSPRSALRRRGPALVARAERAPTSTRCAHRARTRPAAQPGRCRELVPVGQRTAGAGHRARRRPATAGADTRPARRTQPDADLAATGPSSSSRSWTRTEASSHCRSATSTRSDARPRTPAPTRQSPRQRSDGRYYLDVEWRGFGAACEIHGIPHLAVMQWESDLERANEITIAGPRLLVFSSYARPTVGPVARVRRSAATEGCCVAVAAAAGQLHPRRLEIGARPSESCPTSAPRNGTTFGAPRHRARGQAPPPMSSVEAVT